MITDEDITRLQSRAADDVVKNSVITVTIIKSGLVLQVDLRDIFRWERTLIKKNVHYQMVDRRDGQLIGKFLLNETILVPTDYLSRCF